MNIKARNKHCNLIPTAVAILLSCCSPLQPPKTPATTEQQREAKLTTLARLPQSFLYEESAESFEQTLRRGIYRQSTKDKTEYLLIPGDGTAGKRLFCMSPEHGLSVIFFDESEEEYESEGASLYRFDGKELHHVRTYAPTDMQAILPAEAPTPEDLQHP